MVALIDMGWGDLRLADAPNTRVTAEQAEALNALEAVDAGASECRFGDATGEILACRADGRWVEIGTDGNYEDVTEEMIA